MTLLDIIILAFAVFRIALLLVEERGPFDIFGKLRFRVGIRYDANSNPYVNYTKGWRMEVAELFLCIWCMSMWVAMAMVLAYLVAPVLTVWLALPFALSAFVIVLQKRVE